MDDLDPDEYAQATSDLMWQMELADAKGMTWRGMLACMTCRELTMEQARAFVADARERIRMARMRRV